MSYINLSGIFFSPFPDGHFYIRNDINIDINVFCKIFGH